MQQARRAEWLESHDGYSATGDSSLRAVSVTEVLDERSARRCADLIGPLGSDPTSAFFIRRTKSLAYVIRFGNRWFQLNADFFIQPTVYNDFSGGFTRTYRQIPHHVLDHPSIQIVLDAFAQRCGISDGELVMVQAQTSHVRPGDTFRSITGQGIHTDGHDRAMIVCLQRHNIVGAESAVYADLDGQRPILAPFVLTEGQMMFWHDNAVFHHVTPAAVADSAFAGHRTVLLAHWPAVHSLTGELNPNNRLGATLMRPDRQLRRRTEFAGLHWRS